MGCIGVIFIDLKMKDWNEDFNTVSLEEILFKINKEHFGRNMDYVHSQKHYIAFIRRKKNDIFLSCFYIFIIPFDNETDLFHLSFPLEIFFS